MTAVPLHHVVTGKVDGPTVVLLGSLGSTHEMWAPQVEVLGRDFRVVACDLRGHGASPVPPAPWSIDDLADDVVLLLDELGIDRAHVVGLSLGGMVAMHLAARDPGRVDRLVVLCTSALFGPASMWSDRAALVRAEGMDAVADAVVERWFSPGLRATDLETLARMRAMIAATPAEGYAAACGVIERMDLTAELPTIATPTLVIAGADDVATPPSVLESIADAVPGARFAVVGPAAHLASFEQADAVNAELLSHLGAAIS